MTQATLTRNPNKFLDWLDSIGRKSIIPDRVSKGPYLTRYYLLCKNRQWFPINLFLHNFHKSDLDDLHDHPWWFVSFIIKGGYWEHTPQGKKWRGRWSIKFCSAKSLHRIELDPAVDTWTLFLVGPRRRTWGFVDNGTWKPYYQYLKERYGLEHEA